MARSRHRTACTLAGVLLSLALPSAALADGRVPHLPAPATYVVNSTADTPDADVGAPACRDSHGRCTLRAAIMQANFHPGPDTILLPAGTFRLTRPGQEDGAVLGDLDISDSVTIHGRGSAVSIVDGNGAVTHDRVFQVVSPAGLDVTISGLTIRGGVRTGVFDEGGGLFWSSVGNSRLQLSDVVVERNAAYYGGGVYLAFSPSYDVVDLGHVVVRNNVASASVGGLGVSMQSDGSLTIHDSRVSSNTAYEAGGIYVQTADTFPTTAAVLVSRTVVDGNHASLSAGIEQRGSAPLVIESSEVRDNVATYAGGGIGSYGALLLTGSTVANNRAVKGGGLYTYARGSSTLENVTLSGNAARDYGGAAYAEVFAGHPSTIALRNATLSANTAGTAGGGLYRDAGAAITMLNTLLARGAKGANCSEPFGGSFSLADDASCGLGAGDSIGTILLGPLGDHGGPARTQVPRVGSAAVDAGTAAGAPGTDERGIGRPQGAALDVGAVEVCPGAPGRPAITTPGSSAKGPHVTLRWKGVACIETYTVQVRLGSTRGRLVQTAKALHGPLLVTRSLARRRTYYWRVTVVGDRGSAVSAWRHFRVR